MSTVSREEIQSLARLARLALSEEEISSLQDDLSSILDHMRELAEISTEGVEPMTHAMPGALTLRPDRVGESLDRERVLAGCARSEDGEFAVPSILPGADS